MIPTHELIKLRAERWLPQEDMAQLIDEASKEDDSNAEILRNQLFAYAREAQHRFFGNGVFKRGLIEITNHCRKNCNYCGIRTGNRNLIRYRLTDDEILDACRTGYGLGFRTFVMQGGEDPQNTPERMAGVIRRIKAEYPDCAITLSLGEWPRDVYALWREAGADRYLLRHETADADLYASLHPKGTELRSRIECLRSLKELGFQTGCGFMVDSPGQTTRHLVEDLVFIRELQPSMVGIGPFLPHHETVYKDEPPGSVTKTLVMLGILRLMLPDVLLPATTALGTAEQDGRERGILAGANVVMPNLTPQKYRELYLLYDGKISTGEEAAEGNAGLARRMEKIGYELLSVRGDHPSVQDLNKEKKSGTIR
jgi:biotin synthase